MNKIHLAAALATSLLAASAASAAFAQTSGEPSAPGASATALYGKNGAPPESTVPSPASHAGSPKKADTPAINVMSPDKEINFIPKQVLPIPDYSLPSTTRDPATVAQAPIIPSKHLGDPAPKEAKIHEVVSPYDEALECVKSQLTPLMLQTSFTVGTIRDGTGQVNYVDGQGTGTFASQAAEDMMLTSLTKAGVIVIDSSAGFHQQVDWNLQKALANLEGDGNDQVRKNMTTGETSVATKVIHVWEGSITPANVIVQGAVSTLDFVPGGGAEITAPFTIGHLVFHVDLSMDIRATLMPRGTQVGGQIVASDPIARQLDASQNELGISRFFGPPGASTQIAFDIGTQKHEALQAIERAMIDREAAVMVARVNHIVVCDPQVAYGDRLAFEAR